MSPEEKAERERLLAIGDQVIAQWERLERSGKITENTYEDIPPAAIVDIDTKSITLEEMMQLLNGLAKSKNNDN